MVKKLKTIGGQSKLAVQHEEQEVVATLGLAVSFALTRYLGTLLLGVTSTDALTFSSVVVLLCAEALFAGFIPARRAMRLDPMVALRHE